MTDPAPPSPGTTGLHQARGHTQPWAIEEPGAGLRQGSKVNKIQCARCKPHPQATATARKLSCTRVALVGHICSISFGHQESQASLSQQSLILRYSPSGAPLGVGDKLKPDPGEYSRRGRPGRRWAPRGCLHLHTGSDPQSTEDIEACYTAVPTQGHTDRACDWRRARQSHYKDTGNPGEAAPASRSLWRRAATAG